MAVMTAQPPLPLAPEDARPVGAAAAIVEDEDGGRVFVHGNLVYAWDAGDAAGRRFAAVSLMRIKAATQLEVAEAFAVGPATVRRWETRLADDGVAGLFAEPKGPKRKSKLTADAVAAIRRLRAGGASYRGIAAAAGVSVLPGTEKAVSSIEEAQEIAAEIGFPVIVKAAMGGGGRGMRVVHDPEQLAALIEEAQGEAKSAFGDASVFLEKYLPHARHIEVQILGDEHGNLLHLHERDCSVQRRHQKVVEMAPAVNLPERVRNELCEAAVAIARSALA